MAGKQNLGTHGMHPLDEGALLFDDSGIGDHFLRIILCEGIFVFAVESALRRSVEGVALHVDARGTGLYRHYERIYPLFFKLI
jgi:hypothetical protein